MQYFDKLIIIGEEFEQDIRPLVKAFYQNERYEVEVLAYQEEIDRKLQTLTDGMMIQTGADRFRICFLSENRILEDCSETTKRDHKLYRNQLGRAIFRILGKITGRSLPWGILTGVRPTKLVYEMLEQGEKEPKISTHMETEYLCSKEKTELSLTVAKREMQILDQINYRKGYSIYIGIPFCPTTCHYCSFTSFPLAKFESFVDPYLDALEKEIRYAKDLFPEKKLNTVYIGGGTPTTLSPSQLERLLKLVYENFRMDESSEFTVEAGRPDTVTRDKLAVLKDFNVSRISINPQSMNDKTLMAIGRQHSSKQIEEAFSMARELGHNNINMDLIIGLTGETPEDVAETLRRIEHLNPDSLTVHTLALKRAARLNMEGQRFHDIGASDVEKMLILTSEYAREHAYEPYYLYRQKNMTENLENTGYARYGKEGIYNILIMEEKQSILALGAGGSSKILFDTTTEGVRFERVENVKNLNHYIDRIDEMIQRKRDFLDERSI